MKDCALIVAIVAAVASAFGMVFAGLNRGRNAAQAALYASIRSGHVSLPGQAVRDLASAEIYTLWSAFVSTRQVEDGERLLARIRQEEARLALSRRKKKWAKYFTVTISVLILLLFCVANLLAIRFSNSEFAEKCRHIHFCIITGPVLGGPGGHSPADKASSASGRQGPFPPGDASSGSSGGQSGHQGSVGGTPVTKASTSNLPAPKPTAIPPPASANCGISAGEVPCVVGQVAQLGQCALAPVADLVNANALKTNVPDVGSVGRCMTGKSPLSPVSAADGADSVGQSDAAGTEPDGESSAISPLSPGLPGIQVPTVAPLSGHHRARCPSFLDYPRIDPCLGRRPRFVRAFRLAG